MNGCGYKTISASHLKRHKAMVHGIGVTFYLCGVGGCAYEAKDASNLKKHKANIHDIDVT